MVNRLFKLGQPDPRVLYEGIDQLTDGELHRVDSVVRGNLENTRQKIEDTVSDIQQGMGLPSRRPRVFREAGESAWAVAKQIPRRHRGRPKDPPSPRASSAGKPQNPKPAWPEIPVPPDAQAPLLQGYNPQYLPPAINMPGDLSRPEPAPTKMPARIEAEGSYPLQV